MPFGSPLHALRTHADGDLTVTGGVGHDDVADVAPIRRPRLRRCGRFELREELGRGGMGAVYRAWDPSLEREVAVKILRREDERAQERVLAEARALAQLSHPNVVAVHEAGVADGRVYLAMELVEGITLRQWLRDGARSWQEIVRVFARAAAGLEAAHRAGLIHRDFKPDNVLLTPTGRVVVLDFGLAIRSRARAGRPRPRPPVPTSRPLALTASDSSGRVMGTPAYMAPEQHKSERLDARCDQFSFCVALWEALFEARPFAGRDYAEVTRAVLSGAVEPVFGDDVPWHLHGALLRGLSVDREDRFGSMQELARELLRPERVSTAVAAQNDSAAVYALALLPIAAGLVLAPAAAAVGMALLASLVLVRRVATRAAERHGPDARELVLGVPLVSSGFAAACLLGLVWALGPEEAFGSWIPPVILVGQMGINVLRLRPILPLLVASTGTLGLTLVWLATVLGQAGGSPLYMSPGSQLVRASFLLLTGVLLMRVTRHLRDQLDAARALG